MLLGEGSSVMSNKIKDSLKTYLQSGTGINKSKLIIISEDIGYQIDRSASPYYDSAFARSMCGYQYVADRPGVGGRGITGISINTNLTDSTYGPSSDVIKRSVSLPSSQTFNLYKYRLFADSMNSIGRVSASYNVAVMALDVESIRPANDVPYPFSVKRILNGLIKFVDEIPTGDDPENIATVPVKYSLSQNYPNPFNPSTKINYELPVSNYVTIKVYDLTGKEVITLISMKQDAGRYSVTLNGADLSSGMYFYKLTSGDYTETRRMILLK
ncbi:MAG: T9SS type A sorting domain-containing protein [Ignavibacteria bacterium]|nr:T9SS type A sorting domain-containing protein [Ignavibacteria bacterium]